MKECSPKISRRVRVRRLSRTILHSKSIQENGKKATCTDQGNSSCRLMVKPASTEICTKARLKKDLSLVMEQCTSAAIPPSNTILVLGKMELSAEREF